MWGFKSTCQEVPVFGKVVSISVEKGCAKDWKWITKYMLLVDGVDYVGYFSDEVYPTEEEAVAAYEQSKEDSG